MGQHPGADSEFPRVASDVDEPVAVLGSAELAVYEQARRTLESQRQLRGRAEAALADARFIEHAVEREFLRVMSGICEGCGLPTSGRYVVDTAGRVFRNAAGATEPTASDGE